MCAPLLRKILSSWGPPWFFGTTCVALSNHAGRLALLLSPQTCACVVYPVAQSYPRTPFCLVHSHKTHAQSYPLQKRVPFSEGVTGGSKVLHHPARLRSEGRHAARDWAGTLAVEGRSRPGEPAFFCWLISFSVSLSTIPFSTQ